MARKEEAVVATEEIPGAVQEKAPAAPRVPTKYNRTDKTPAKEIRGQAKEVFDALNAAGSEALSAEDIAARCVFAGSRQDKVRVAAFYVAKFKKEGLIVAVGAPAAAEAPAGEPVTA